MAHLLTSASRLTIILWFIFYTYDSFASLRRGASEEVQSSRSHRQTGFMYLILINANLVIFMNYQDVSVLLLGLIEAVFLAVCLLIFKNAYSRGNKAIVNNMCMLLCISFIILSRLDTGKAIRQLMIAIVALVATALVPLFIDKIKIWNRLTWLYAVLGIALLAVVAGAGSTVYGAKLNITIGGITIQPSEFVKILFVFFTASMLSKSVSFPRIVVTTIVAAIHVLILVASRDLGGAGIFLITYLVMLFVATKKPGYLFAGIGLSVVAALIAYAVFPHVRTRVIAWKNPLSVADGAGYQICQSLFAIGTGGWLGSGLCEGMPDKIPVVESDFVFSAISEELGGIFALCLIFVCLNCFLLFLNLSMEISDRFYKLIALGLGTVYGTQVFIMIGGVTKFIPSTGVTLPLVSYGGSSLLATMIMFAIIQGLYVRSREEVYSGKKKEYR